MQAMWLRERKRKFADEKFRHEKNYRIKKIKHEQNIKSLQIAQLKGKIYIFYRLEKTKT